MHVEQATKRAFGIVIGPPAREADSLIFRPGSIFQHPVEPRASWAWSPVEFQGTICFGRRDLGDDDLLKESQI